MYKAMWFCHCPMHFRTFLLPARSPTCVICQTPPLPPPSTRQPLLQASHCGFACPASASSLLWGVSVTRPSSIIAGIWISVPHGWLVALFQPFWDLGLCPQRKKGWQDLPSRPCCSQHKWLGSGLFISNSICGLARSSHILEACNPITTIPSRSPERGV